MWFLTWNDVQYNRMRVPDDCDVSCYLVYNPVRTFVLGVQRYEKTIRTSEVLRKKCGIRGKIDFRHVKSAWNVDFCHDYAAVLFKNNASFSLKQCSSSIKNNAVFVTNYISGKTRMPPKSLRRHTVYSWNDKQK